MLPKYFKNILQFKQVRCPNKRFSSQSGQNIWNVPLDKPVPGLPVPIYAKPSKQIEETKVTTLPNGLRVASEKKFGHFCTVGVVIDSGSRYEVAYPSGISHFLDKVAYNSTLNYRNKDVMLHELERFGGICDCQSSRDTQIYAVSAEVRGLDKVVDILSDAVLRPCLTDQEIEGARQAIGFELQDLDIRPEQDAILTEMIHSAAFSDNTLGLAKICPLENVRKIDAEALFTYMKHHFTPSRMVVAGVGVEHDALVESVQRHFVDKPAIWEGDRHVKKSVPIDDSLAQYTGGMLKRDKDLSNVSLGPTPLPELVHFVLGLESSSHQDQDFIAFCVLNMLMGGGGSFSAGGPGKGMYTRLYTNVLNRFHWMYNATAYNHSYNDSGVFCIHASAHPSHIGDLVEVICKEFALMAGDVGTIELERAKKQLQSLLLMNLEARPVVFEDIGRQVLATGKRRPAEYFMEEISRITSEDLHRIATRMLRSRPAVAALGNVENLPKMKSIQASLNKPPAEKASVFSLFRS